MEYLSKEHNKLKTKALAKIKTIEKKIINMIEKKGRRENDTCKFNREFRDFLEKEDLQSKNYQLWSFLMNAFERMESQYC